MHVRSYDWESGGWHGLWVNDMSAARDEEPFSSLDAGSLGEALSLGSVLDCVLLQSCEVNKTLAAPHTLKLCFPRVHALVLGQVLALLETLVAAGALERLLPGVDSPMALQLRRVPEALFAVGTFERLLAGRVAAVLNKFRGGHEALVAQGAFQGLLCAVRVLVALQRGILFVTFPTHFALVGLLHLAATFVPQQFP